MQESKKIKTIFFSFSKALIFLYQTSSQMILGKMQEDVEFLEDFIKFQSKQNIGQKGLKMTAVSALDYLEKRKTFWQQTVVTKN